LIKTANDSIGHTPIIRGRDNYQTDDRYAELEKPTRHEWNAERQTPYGYEEDRTYQNLAEDRRNLAIAEDDDRRRNLAEQEERRRNSLLVQEEDRRRNSIAIRERDQHVRREESFDEVVDYREEPRVEYREPRVEYREPARVEYREPV
jgi:hypothetical protein